MSTTIDHEITPDDSALVNGISNQERLIVFSRYPEPGVTKTRMIPALGPERAAKLQQALTTHVLRTATDYCQRHPCDLEVRFYGGDEMRMADLFGRDKKYVRQQGTDLGEKMLSAIQDAFGDGATQVLVIGSDCPDIDTTILEHAMRALSDHDVVLGPAIDGGYYLIGLRSPRESSLFSEIDWGSDTVLRQTIAKAKNAKCRVHCLPTLSDVDHPEDLVVCRRFAETFVEVLPQTRDGILSVIIPTLNEERCLEHTLRPLVTRPDVEIIVADGGSHDVTIEIAERMGACVVSSAAGRGRQMNVGASLASGDALLFLHADTQLPDTFVEQIRTTLKQGAIAGAFPLRIDGEGRSLRWIQRGVNFRSRVLRRPYGDQGLFVSADCFFRIGGFPNWPLMEDVELCRRLRKHGSIALANQPVTTSARRWSRLGPVRTTLINQLCITGFQLGVSPTTLDRWYRWRH